MNGSSEPATFPSAGALLGIDFGAKRLGFAVCDRDQSIASPLENYERRTLELDARKLRLVVEEYRIVGLVVGLPVHMSGEEGAKASEARVFGEWAAKAVDRPLTFWDERHSSQRADEILQLAELTKKKRKHRRDMLAAQAILQSYLDAPDRSAKPVDLRNP